MHQKHCPDTTDNPHSAGTSMTDASHILRQWVKTVPDTPSNRPNGIAIEFFHGSSHKFAFAEVRSAPIADAWERPVECLEWAESGMAASGREASKTDIQLVVGIVVT
jgi:hypothetical protein